MKQTTAAWLVVTIVLSGCVTDGTTPANMMESGCSGRCGVGRPQAVSGISGPYGEPIAAAAQYSGKPMTGEQAAQAVIARTIGINQLPPGMMAGAPSNILQASAMASAGPDSIMQAGGCPPGGCPPPGGFINGPPGGVAAIGALGTCGGPPGCGPRFNSSRTSVRFASPPGMKVAWYAPSAGGGAGFSGTQLEAPGRYNFLQGAIYRLKLGDIPNRPGLELYPTLEVVPANSKTYPFLAHSAVPVAFTDEDFDQVAAGNFVVKVIYLPDPQFQDLATATDEVVSSRLEPGVDPIAEAHRRGSILLVIRMGNIDLEAPNTPSMDAPSAYAPRPPAGPPPGAAAMGPEGPMMPGAMAGRGMPMMGPGMPMMGPGMGQGMGQGMPMMGQGMGPGMPMMGPGMGQGMPMMGPGMGQSMGPGMPMMGQRPMAPRLMANPGMLPNTMPAREPGPHVLPNLDNKQSKANRREPVIQASTNAVLASGDTSHSAKPADRPAASDAKNAKDRASAEGAKKPAKRGGWWRNQ